MANNLARGSGYLTDTGTTVLYTCPALTQAWVKSIVVVNENATTDRQFELYRNLSATPFLISDALQALASKKHQDFGVGYALLPGDTIEGWADVASEVNYAISVIEKT
jgi:hypothetical protein